MLRLIALLRSEYDSLQETKHRQEDEIRSLKERFLTTGEEVRGPMARASLWTRARNVMSRMRCARCDVRRGHGALGRIAQDTRGT